MSLFNRKKKETGEPKKRKIPTGDLQAYSGRAYARQSISILVLIVLCQMAVIFYLIFNSYLVTTELNKSNFAVFSEKCDGSIDVANISNYQKDAGSLTVKSIAWNVMRLFKSAGTGNADVVYDEAKRLMTKDMKEAFTTIAELDKVALQRQGSSNQGVYRAIDPQSVVIKMLEKDDLPPGSKTEVTPYDAVVSGTLRYYASESKIQLGQPENFSFAIKTVPLEARSEGNPWGLLVGGMEVLDASKSVRALQKARSEKEKNSSSGSFVGDSLGLTPEQMKKDQEQIRRENEENK